MSSPEYTNGASCATEPKVTLGVCVRNSEKFIKETIKSILDQDYPHDHIELIFVDDGSEDNTLSIIQGCTQRIDLKTKIFHTSWKGVGHARNIAVANADSSFVLWVDGDMIISSDYVRKLVDVMQQHCEVGMAKGRLAVGYGSNLLATLEAYSRAVNTNIANFGSKNERSKAFGTGGAMYRIEALQSVGGFDENLKGYCEDWDIEIKIRNAGWSMCVVDAKCLDYERHGLTWRSLWNRYRRRGYFTHYFVHARTGLIKHYRWFPPASFLSGLIYALRYYKITHQKRVFLLPFHYLFKMTAFYVGFLRSHLSSYQPK